MTLEGIAADAGALLAAPYSTTPCIAYWARSTTSDPDDEARDAGIDLEQRTASRDFTLDLGELRVVVAAARAELVFDRARATIIDGEGTRSRREEILLQPGDRVVVRGTLTRQTDAPFRATAQLSGRVTVVLDAWR